MAHNITSRDGMFTVRTPAWHGLGEVFPEHPTREAAQQIAHPWEPVTEPVYRSIPIIDPWRGPSVEYQKIEGQQAVVRSDTGETLGVVNSTYEPVLNQEMYDIAEAIEGGDPTAVQYETGGSLLGGRKVWLLLRLAEPITILGDNSATIPYYALQNSHDGSGAFRGQATMTRIVCDNTSKAADIDAQRRGTEFIFRHTSNVRSRIEEAREALKGWRESIVEYNRAMTHLIGLTATKDQQEEFIETFIPMPPPHMISERVIHNIDTARETFREIMAGPTLEGIDNTAYGLVQASIEYHQHYRAARSDQSRFRRAYLDRSTVTQDALALALELVK